MSDSDGTIRILIADDHAIFRDALKTLIAGEPEFEIIGEASDGQEALELIRKLDPDILLLDCIMPKISGIEVLQKLSDRQYRTRAILLSGGANHDEISKAFRLGARGYVLKESAANTLFKSMRAVMADKYWIGTKSVSRLPQANGHTVSTRSHSLKDFGLTARELEIVRAVAEGFANKDIAGRLSISEQTVKHHITNIYDKLGVYNRLELTLFAFHHGLVDMEGEAK
jgi:two-component system nitrate/nitrite response regulator NarL